MQTHDSELVLRISPNVRRVLSAASLGNVYRYIKAAGVWDDLLVNCLCSLIYVLAAQPLGTSLLFYTRLSLTRPRSSLED
jgi:hypothetical protein